METPTPTVRDIMVKDVSSVHPETSLVETAQILDEKNFNGLPVVDEENKLLGIVTEYDLVSKGSAIHLPTFQKILENLSLFKKDRSYFQEEVKAVTQLKVADVMNHDPITFDEDTSFEEAVITFRDHHRVNPIPVLDKDHHVIGVVSRFDIFKSLLLFSSKVSQE